MDAGVTALFDALPIKRGNTYGGDDWRLVRGDCLSVLSPLPEKSVDLVFADPPYNLQLKNELYRPNMTRVNGVNDAWDKFDSFAYYDTFCEKWLLECRRVLKDDGAIWVIGTYHNIGRLARLMQDIGYWMLNDVIWHKTNPMPNFRGVRFTNATETLLWAKKSEKSRYVFNHQTMKAENDGKQMTNVWMFPLCGGKERLRDADGVKRHPTQKPEALLRRVILSSTRVGAVVLDPFVGSGTTVAVARQLGRIGVGIEKEKNYLTVARERVKNVSRQEKLPIEVVEKPKRVLFSELLRKGLIKKGAHLYAKALKDTPALVQEDGIIRLNGYAGSIHQVGAHIAKTPSCNGWNFWSIKDKKGNLVSIDLLREQIRQEKC